MFADFPPHRPMTKLLIRREEAILRRMPNASDPGVQVWRDNDGMVCAYGYTANDEHYMQLPGLATFSFSNHSDDVVALAEPSAADEWIRDAYWRSVLPMVLQARGKEVLHASAVRTPHGVVALCAVSETGKSTIAFGLSQRSYDLWADDAVAFEVGERDVRAIPLQFRIRLRPASATYFGQPSTDPGELSDFVDGRQREALSAPLTAIFVLEREASEESVVKTEQLAPAAAVPALLTHAYCFSTEEPERMGQMVQQYIDLTLQTPVYVIRFQPGLPNLPAILDEIERVVAVTPPRRPQ